MVVVQLLTRSHCAAARTKNFSGAELEGLVKSATSFALNRQVDVSNLNKPIDEDNIKVRDLRHILLDELLRWGTAALFPQGLSLHLTRSQHAQQDANAQRQMASPRNSREHDGTPGASH